ncbi:hypothetical protein LZ30DRAFT_223172 [Colletotrichum cereale]|nr:hypothetical protein LZ30DRAFT_223172 [Colletotrichum cereale]
MARGWTSATRPVPWYLHFRNLTATPSIKRCKLASAKRTMRQNRAGRALPGTMEHCRGNLRQVSAKAMLGQVGEEPPSHFSVYPLSHHPSPVFVATKVLHERLARWSLGSSASTWPYLTFLVNLGSFRCTSAYTSAEWQSHRTWKAPWVFSGTGTILGFVVTT